jgi:hypothetical protein
VGAFWRTREKRSYGIRNQSILLNMSTQNYTKQGTSTEHNKEKAAYGYYLRSMEKQPDDTRRFHVMNITGVTSFSWGNFTQPVHMYKETPEVRRLKWKLKKQEKTMKEDMTASSSIRPLPKPAESAKQERMEEVGGSIGTIAPFGVQPPRKNLFKKRTIILARGSAPKPPRDAEASSDRWPMILEDDDGMNAYTGIVEGNSRSTYVLFIREVNLTRKVV